MEKAIVIGAGIGGLAVAIRLARMGYKVLVFEASDIAGGKISEFRKDQFRFDTGPSLFTLPELVDELLDEKHRFKYTRLPVITRYFWTDGTVLNSFADPVMFAAEAENLTGENSKSIIKYLNETAILFRLIAPVFIFSSIHRLKSIVRIKNLPALFGLPRLKAMATLHQINSKAFTDYRIIQLFDRYATYNGSSPFRTPGTLSVIAHLEHNSGAFLPEKGMYSIVQSLYNQAADLGVEFHFNNKVDKIILRKSSVEGIVAGGKEISCDLLVSDIDIENFYSNLLPDPSQLAKARHSEHSSSALIFYWGMDRQFQNLDVHNIFFSDDYEAEFRDIFERKILPSDPTIYIYVSSKHISSDAPAGCENWFVMINVPENIGQDWKNVAQEVKSSILEKLNGIMGIKVEKSIQFERILDPSQMELLTGSVNGSLYGPSSNNRYAAFRRHPNFSRKYKGLYFTGGSVHPGGGIPLCLSSAKIVSSLIQDTKQ
jgi:diapolycopene oxygenase